MIMSGMPMCSRVPVISRFLGIAIAILYNDHEPPHFHATYAGHRITVGIRDGSTKGRFPRRAGWSAMGARETLMDELVAVVEARHVREHVLWLRFSDGLAGEVDLAGRLRGPVFEPLQNVALFAQVRVDPELQTIAWPNGADLAPEYLHELCASRAAA